jgi:uncharacterized membrane protein
MIHPITVHFPIVLAFLWPILDFAGWWWKRPDLSKAAVGLLILLVVASFVSVVSGQSAFDTAVALKIDPQLLNTHADDANLVPWAMVLILIVRTAGVLKLGRRAHAAAIALGVSSWWLIYVVGASGGALVFDHGVGVTVEQGGPNR